MTEFGIPLSGVSLQHNDGGVQKNRGEGKGWVDRNPSKKGADNKVNPPSPKRHEDGRTRPKPGSRGK